MRSTQRTTQRAPPRCSTCPTPCCFWVERRRPLPFAERGVEIQRVRLPSDHPKRINGLLEMFWLLQSLGRGEEGLELLQEARQIAKSRLPEGHPRQLGLLYALAHAQASRGDHAAAVGTMDTYLDRAEQTGRQKEVLVVAGHIGAGRYLLRAGHADRARDRLKAALQLTKGATWRHKPLRAQGLFSHALALHALGNTGEALKELEQAIALGEQADWRDTYSAYATAGKWLWELGHAARARRALERARDHIESRWHAARGLDLAERAQYSAYLRDIDVCDYLVAARLADGSADAAFAELERSRGRAACRAPQSRQRQGTRPAPRRDLRKSQRSDLPRSGAHAGGRCRGPGGSLEARGRTRSSSRPPRPAPGVGRSLRRRTARGTCSTSHRAPSPSRRSPSDASSNRCVCTGQSFPPGSTLLAYQIGDAATVVFELRRDGLEAHPLEASREQIGEAVAAYVDALSSPTTPKQRGARNLLGKAPRTNAHSADPAGIAPCGVGGCTSCPMGPFTDSPSRPWSRGSSRAKRATGSMSGRPSPTSMRGLHWLRSATVRRCGCTRPGS